MEMCGIDLKTTTGTVITFIFSMAKHLKVFVDNKNLTRVQML